MEATRKRPASRRKRNGWQDNATHFFFGRPVGPPGPAASQAGIGRIRCSEIRTCASCYGMCGRLTPPSRSPDQLSHEQDVKSARRGLPQKNESRRTDSILLWCFGYNKTTGKNRGHEVLAKEKGRLLQRPREIVRHESGVRCPRSSYQAHPGRFPDASLSDHDIDRLKIPLDIGSPPLDCC